MSTFRVNKNVNYTVMSNHHLQDKRLSLKAKGLLSYMLSLPDDWDYSLKGLTTGCRDGIDSVRSAVHELEDGGYLCRSKVRDARGRIIDYNYEVFELPQKERIEKRPAPVPNSPSSENPMSGFPTLENPTQQNTNKQNTKRQSTNLSGQTDESADFDQTEAQVREEFRERLEIDTLAQRYDPDKLEELLDNIVEMYCCPRQTQYIGKQPQTTKAIRLRLDKLTSQHIEYIFDVMSNTTQPIKNIMAYLRTTMAVFDITQKVVSDSSGIIAGNTRVNDIGLSMLEASLMQMDVGPLFGLFLQSFFIGITMRILSIIIFVIVYGRMIEIYCMVSLAPIPMATWGNHEQSHMGQNYLKCLFALGFQGFLILICVAIYAVLIQSVAISGDAINSIWSIVGYTVLLCFSLFKTSSVTKSVLGAH